MTISDDKISDIAYLLANILDSNIFKDYVADTIVDLANNQDVSLTKELVVNANSWEEDLKLIKKALNMNNEGFNKANVEEVLLGIKTSSLLGPIKEELLINTIKKVSIEGITIDNSITSEDIDYDIEMDAILVAADQLTLLEDISSTSFDLESVVNDTTKLNNLSSILNKGLKSQLFKTSISDNLVKVLNDNDIKNDLDTTGNTNLINSIYSVNDWNEELTNIKSLLDVDSKDKLTNEIFTLIEDSSLLGGCKANIMIKMVNEVNKGISNEDDKLTVPSVSELLNVIDSSNNITQYDLEKEILLKASDIDNIEASNIDNSNKEVIASLLNGMKESVIFDKQYNTLIKEIGDTIKEKESTVTIKDNPQITDWNQELTTLIEIRDTVKSASEAKLTDSGVATTIANVLDKMDQSELISDDSSQNLANSIVTKWNGNTPTSIDKGEGQTWKEAFEAKINELKGA